jgi:hypothetical protein
MAGSVWLAQPYFVGNIETEHAAFNCLHQEFDLCGWSRSRSAPGFARKSVAGRGQPVNQLIRVVRDSLGHLCRDRPRHVPVLGFDDKVAKVDQS